MATQEPTQSNDSREKMGRSKRSNWFIRYCCCCCACCCREDDVHRPLLHSTTPKEQTPVPAASPVAAERKEDGEGVSAEETQQVQLVVADVEEEAPDSEPEEGTDKDKPAKDKGEKPVELEIDLEPTERARVSSGTFVRGSSQRASWRLVPSFTQQVKEQAREAANGSEGAETEEGAPANQGSNDENKQIEGEQISFKSDGNEEPSTSDRNVTLVSQDIDDEDASLEEPVTMTFTIGSRGNQEAPNSSTQEHSTPIDDEQRLQGQGEVGERMTSSAITTTDQDDTNLESSNDMDQPTTPILTQQH